MMITNIHAEQFDCTQNRHDYVQIQYTPPTETTDGRAVYQCRLCGRRTTRVLFATACEWSEWTIVRQPTCTQTGLRRRICSVGVTHSEYEEIPALEHEWSDWIIDTPARPGVEGRQYMECSICGERIYEPIPALPVTHEPTPDITTPSPTTGPPESTEEPLPEPTEPPSEPTPEPTPELPPIPPPSGPLFGVEEVIITGANISLWVILFLVLFGEILFVKWIRKRKKEILEQQQFAYSGKDGYKFI